MLLNEFLKEHCKVAEHGRKAREHEATIARLNSTVAKQKETIAQLTSTVAQQHKDFQATFAHQQKQIEALTAGLQKVSTQLEASKPCAAIGPQQSVKLRHGFERYNCSRISQSPVPEAGLVEPWRRLMTAEL